jgi:hypothetical protein
MTALDWRLLKGVDFTRLVDARLQAHHAAQWLSRAAFAYISPNSDDSHSNLGWEEAFNGFATHKLQGARIGLKLFPLSLAILEGKDVAPSRILNLDGHKEADLRAWLGEEMGSLGLDARLLDKAPPYKIPPHKIASGSPYSVNGIDEIMRDLAAWYSNANRSIGRIAEAMRKNKLQVSAVRCWPHHFDLAALVTVAAAKETVESARSVGIGLSPGDEHYGEPYFYVTPWPYPAPSKLPPVPEIGRWHTQNFTAAIAPAHKSLAASGRQTETEQFLDAAVAAALKSFD